MKMAMLKMIKNTTLFYCLLVLIPSFGQSTIPTDLLTLSELTLEKSPLIQRNELLIDQSEANLRNQKSIFDYNLSSSLTSRRTEQTLFDADPRNQILGVDLVTKNTGVSLALQKQFRTGLIANLSTDYSRVFNNFPFNAFNEEVGANISDHVSAATLSLTQPLLRNNGLKVVTAFEKSAALEIKSTEANFVLNTAFELQQLASAYWQYVGAYESFIIFKENEARVRKVLEVTKELVNADKRPASELVQIQADLAEQERQSKAAAQALYNSRLALGRVIGLTEAESKGLSEPLDDFPVVNDAILEEVKQFDQLNKIALENRTDITAVDYSLQGLELQLHAAKNGTLPQLDLSVFYTLGGAAVGGGLENYFNAFGNQQGRNNVRGLGLNFTFPINNNRAKANLALNHIAVQDQEIARNNLKRNISLNVSIAANNLENSVFIVKKAKETLGYYQQVFENEQIKFQNGLTTLLNLILFQERLTFAQLEYLNAQQQYAVALTNLRFETGTLVKTSPNNKVRIERMNFYTLPKNN